MSRDRYYIRVHSADVPTFLEFCERSAFPSMHLSTDMSNNGGSTLYSVLMDTQEIMALKLAIPLVGCMHFTKTMGKLKDHRGEYIA